jgi:hypothetical protein
LRVALKLLAGAADEAVERPAMAALCALFELCVDVERHLGVRVTDLAHHPFHVEVVGKERERDVGASQRMRGGVRQGGETTRRLYGALIERVRTERPENALVNALSAPTQTALSGVFATTAAEARTGLSVMRSALLSAS